MLRGLAGDYDFFVSAGFAEAAPATAEAPAAVPIGGTTVVGHPTLMVVMASSAAAKSQSLAGELVPMADTTAAATAASCLDHVIVRRGSLRVDSG